MATPEALALEMLDLTDRHEWAAREALLTPDCDVVMPSAALRTPAAATAYSETFVGAFADARHRVDLVAASGDTVVVEGVWIGTHTGPLVTPDGEIPATGRPLNLPFAMTVRTDGERVASLHVYFDQLAFLTQLGLVPQPQAA